MFKKLNWEKVLGWVVVITTFLLMFLLIYSFYLASEELAIG